MIDDCNQFLDQYYEGLGQAGYVLEAGGGSFSHFHFPESMELLALDISFTQLAKNDDVPARVQADVHQLPLKDQCVNGIVCFNVIEHLDNPAAALNEMSRSLAEDGILVLGCPNRASLKGLITYMTPIAFHRWYYRVIVGKKDRGDGHFDAFPTPFRKIVSDKLLRQWLQEQEFELLYYKVYDGAAAYHITTGSLARQLFSLPYYMICRLVSLVSLGRMNLEKSDILLVARK